MTTVFDVAKWFLLKESMTNKKLQKLVYYAYAWAQVFLNEPENEKTQALFDERIEAWVHGPVCPELYANYKKYGWSLIPRPEDVKPVFSEEVEEVLEAVWEAYGELTAYQLEELTHSEIPWIKARKDCNPVEPCNNIISDQDMFRFYSNVLKNG